MKLHLIMPMGGKGSRFSKYGYEFPKPLLEINRFSTGQHSLLQSL